MTDDREFLAQFEACTWPLERWHHREHLKVAYLYSLHHPLDEAIGRMRAGIQAFNGVWQVPEGPESGYHETLTQAWLRLVHATLSANGPAGTADAFLARHPRLADKRLLLDYYTRDLIMSARAKTEFVEPDLVPLTELPR
ncbi:MAG: hypothetical protein A2W00_14975 [Candidatus Eisenbacteria bacterium RBG_16_71_46]|nr:MAG: hypothetical protein A2W00_14975 [Candidatus Eisenbacteria bacterium RBG_16_71_46]OGF24062.1 MAG: hypothetical protein A2V63_08000 [Candidatus Eisenbacteria bacterium RBG_19FT_COMBO_70_11]